LVVEFGVVLLVVGFASTIFLV